MPLHPEVIQFLETQRSLELKPIEQCTPDEFRKVMRLAIPANGEAEPMEAGEDREVIGNVGPIPLRIYRPQARKSAGALVYYHGGGWVGGRRRRLEGVLGGGDRRLLKSRHRCCVP